MTINRVSRIQSQEALATFDAEFMPRAKLVF